MNATVAEHWLYLPSVGFFIFAAGYLAKLPQRHWKFAVAFAQYHIYRITHRNLDAHIVQRDFGIIIAASKNAETAFDKLSVAAGSGDMAVLTVAFGDAGKACGACHEKFRAKAN